ncbi:hypothetical protein CEXT_390901 [Caerostris extrusa]|uniref:Uncharacterized protein n=1 Tax=Caerostris extrusa TaxID=172846 RepID=A0AAV4MA55_CAEEX|nr:hypothetical protein CEXT_390901 [Caerostris extrusa]
MPSSSSSSSSIPLSRPMNPLSLLTVLADVEHLFVRSTLALLKQELRANIPGPLNLLTTLPFLAAVEHLFVRSIIVLLKQELRANIPGVTSEILYPRREYCLPNGLIGVTAPHLHIV